ncbi:hypothetical protein UFOVP315_17 [uncultured Caudovirales phage]|uniref:Uncharacterized protein n=1 Tax=uncultured Caudovirales phage TaxID=2100421 RepID=A0A6J5LR14_9CAUD|nr:hypothetical protein UFOVP315_17 [uncultured Caudovirales phage]
MRALLIAGLIFYPIPENDDCQPAVELLAQLRADQYQLVFAQRGLDDVVRQMWVRHADGHAIYIEPRGTSFCIADTGTIHMEKPK